MLLLQRGDGADAFAHRADPFDARGRGGQRRDAGDAELQGDLADVGVVEERAAAERRVDDQRHFAVDHAVDDVRARTSCTFHTSADLDAVLREELARAADVAISLKPRSCRSRASCTTSGALVVVVDGDERACRRSGSFDARAEQRLRVRLAEVRR